MTRNRILCLECDGRQIVLSQHGVVTDCGRCLGRGWVSLPAAVIQRDVVIPAVLLSALGFLVVVAAVVLL